MFRVDHCCYIFPLKKGTCIIFGLDLVFTGSFELVFMYLFLTGKETSIDRDNPLFVMKVCLMSLKLLAITYGLIGIIEKRPSYLSLYIYVNATLVVLSIFLLSFVGLRFPRSIEKNTASDTTSEKNALSYQNFIQGSPRMEQNPAGIMNPQVYFFIPDLIHLVFSVLIAYSCIVVFSYQKVLEEELCSLRKANLLLSAPVEETYSI